VAKLASLFVKVGALLFIIVLPTKYAIDLQLLGGVWILQTLPSVALGLYTRWFDARALLLGWLGGMAVGTYMAFDLSFESSVYPLNLFGLSLNMYEGIYAIVVNLVIAVVVTLILRATGAGDRADETVREDYEERVEGEERPVPATPEQEERFRREGEPARPRQAPRS
jgi:solute:Na+ symporter, SSS family